MRWVLLAVIGIAGCGRIDFDSLRDGGAAGGDTHGDSGGGFVGHGETYIKATNTDTGDGFGNLVAICADGTTLAVAAYNEQASTRGIDGNQLDNAGSSVGAVYVYVRQGATWVPQAYLKASNADSSDLFGGGSGLAISADGNTLAVAAVGEGSAATGINGNQASNASTGSGAVYVFVRAGTTWTQQAYVKASNTNAVDGFGNGVALSADGNTLAVGAANEDSAALGIGGNQLDNSALASGAVYVYTRAGVVWIQEAYVKASNTGAGDFFGTYVALAGDGNTMAVSAFTEGSAATGIDGDQANNAAVGAGAVYTYTRAGTVWTQQSYIKASNAQAGDSFGPVALSQDGRTLVVTAVLEDSAATTIDGNQSDNSAMSAGAAYVFVAGANTWAQQAYLKAPNAEAGDAFGVTVAIDASGDEIVIGAESESSAATGIGAVQFDNTASQSGAAYVYARSAGTWSMLAYVKASNTGSTDSFGTSVAISGDGSTVVVGAFDEASAATGVGGDQSDNSAMNAGAAYVVE